MNRSTNKQPEKAASAKKDQTKKVAVKVVKNSTGKTLRDINEKKQSKSRATEESQQIKKLPKEFYQRDSLYVAQDLIGCFLVRNTPEGPIIGRINEVEAYRGGKDKGSHAYGELRTARTEPLYEAGGIAYIHLIYGMYYCYNAVANLEGIPQSALLRGVEVVEGFDLAALDRYKIPYDQMTKAQKKNFTNGPGKLCMAFDISTDLNRIDLTGDTLFICEQYHGHKKQVGKIEASKRIGIDYAEEAKDFLWRFTG